MMGKERARPPRLRPGLRTKLVLVLALAAIVPVGASSLAGLRLVRANLEEALRGGTQRAVEVALSLTLQHVEEMGRAANRLGESASLATALGAVGDRAASPDDVASVLAGEDSYLPAGLVEIADAHGHVVARRAIGPERRLAGVQSADGSDAIAGALRYERRATLKTVGAGMTARLVVRASAPIVDDALALRGAVVLSVPLDADFADMIKGTTGIDVLIHAGEAPAATTFVDAAGRRVEGLAAPPSVLHDVLDAGRSPVLPIRVGDSDLEAAYVPLQNVDGERVGVLGAAVPRATLERAQRAGARSLALGALAALLLALSLAMMLGRRLTRPLAALHRAALDVAEGQIDVSLPAAVLAAGDELGELARAFQRMTTALRENVDRIASFTQELEDKVQERTKDLTRANRELAAALAQLRDAQAQVLLSDRLAGLGALVAGVAHEINSPAAAVQGAADTLPGTCAALAAGARGIAAMPLPPDERRALAERMDAAAQEAAKRGIESPARVRRASREISARLAGASLRAGDAEELARVLAELGLAELVDTFEMLCREGVEVAPAVQYLRARFHLLRSSAAITEAVHRIARIVGALKSYSHLDQAKIEPSDLRDGIETTLVILQHEMKYGIHVVRRYAPLPPVPVYVDELNQVWTNLLHNAVQALGGKGEIVIETAVEGDGVVVAIADDGPGIPPEILPRIFEPFFTTKPKGEGSGLGLDIVRKIVGKHGGKVDVESRPGRTCFTIRLPIAGPGAAARAATPPGTGPGAKEAAAR